jgi:predicted GNAT family acetyltransferase
VEITMRHDPAARRYELVLDGALVGIADYRVTDEAIQFHHTEVLPAWRNRGLAARLIAYALEDVRHTGKTVVPTCWYVAQYVREHPEAVNAAPAPNSTDG